MSEPFIFFMARRYNDWGIEGLAKTFWGPVAVTAPSIHRNIRDTSIKDLNQVAEDVRDPCRLAAFKKSYGKTALVPGWVYFQFKVEEESIRADGNLEAAGTVARAVLADGHLAKKIATIFNADMTTFVEFVMIGDKAQQLAGNATGVTISPYTNAAVATQFLIFQALNDVVFEVEKSLAH